MSAPREVTERAEYARLTAKIDTVPGRFAGALPAADRRRWYDLHAKYGPAPELSRAFDRAGLA